MNESMLSRSSELLMASERDGQPPTKDDALTVRVEMDVAFGAAQLLSALIDLFVDNRTEVDENGMRMETFHVNERGVGDESCVRPLQRTAKDAVVQSRHEQKCDRECFDDAECARDHAQAAVEEEIEIGEDEVDAQVSQHHRLASPKERKCNARSSLQARARLLLQEERL